MQKIYDIMGKITQRKGKFMSENGNNLNTTAEQESKQTHNTRIERRSRWLDESGLLEGYFQIGKNLITTKADYFIVLDKFAESGLAPRAFCAKYGIMNAYGFERALERRRAEDPEYDERLTLASKEASKRAVATVVSVITKTLKNTSALGEAIRSGELAGVNLDKFMSICEKLNKDDTKLSDNMTKLIAKYYFDRLNSYKTESDINKLLNNQEIAFMLPSGEEKIHEQKAFGIDTYPAEYFIRKMANLKNIDEKLYKLCVVGKHPSSIESCLKKYNYKFDMKKFLETKTEYIINAQASTVTPAEARAAVAYASLNNIYPGNGAIRDIIRAVKLGIVKPTKELQDEVERMVAESQKTKPDFESVNDYFNE